MNDHSAGALREKSMPSGPWPIRSGRTPALATEYLAFRTETGYGLDIGSEAAVHQRAGGTGPEITVLTGPGGYGKTHLAAAFASRLASSDESELQVWINGSSKWTIMAGHAQAARDIGISHGGARLDASVARFLDWLGRANVTWTVVYDDVADLEQLAELMPETSAGHVIVTCGQAVHPSDATKLFGVEPRVCQVGEFSPRESLSYLAARLQHDAHDRGQAVDLAADLGHVPLALNLAAATITGSTLDCREYRGRLAGRSYDLAQMTGGWVPPVAAAASLAIELADQGPPIGLARAALALITLIDGGGVPVQVPMSRAGIGFLSACSAAPVDQRQVWAGVVNLARCGLVMIDHSGGVPLVFVHPEVQGVVRRLLPGALLTSAARAAADALLEVAPQLQAEPYLKQALGDCVTKLCQGTGDLLWAPAPHPVIAGTGERLDGPGQAAGLIAYWQSVLEASLRFLGPGHAESLAFRDALAGACQEAGRFDDAIALADISVAERERLHGSGHPDVLAARVTLATRYRAAGRLEAAIDVAERVLADLLATLGAGHPQTMAARSQLAAMCRQAGLHDRAIALYQQNVADLTRLRGPEHREVLAEQMSLGRALQSAGRPDDAVAVFRRLRATKEQTLGAHDLDTLAVTVLLAASYQAAGRAKDAINWYRQALNGREAVVGPDHPDTLGTVAKLASCYHAANRFKEAIPLYERSVAGCEAVHGRDHPETLTARGNLAGVYHSSGRLNDALVVYEQAVADFERVLGRQHRDTLTARSNLAQAYHAARRRTQSLEMFERVLADAEQALGPDDPLTRAIREIYEVASG